jgi:nucleotide-binding universal stress UspA family protein
MTTFKHILFPVAFSAQCQIAARYVASYARQFDADVTLLNVEMLPTHPYYWESQKERLTELLGQFLVDEFAGIKVKRCVLAGDPANEITRYAKNEQTDLVMMPTHGWGAFRRLLLGSVTAKVLHDTPYPVWTSAHIHGERATAPTTLLNVVCAVDLDDTGIHTLRYAANFARRTGARLTVAHAVPEIQTLPAASMDADFRSDLIEAARKRLAEMQDRAECAGVICIGAGNIERLVSHAAESHHADLVIIGRGGNSVLGRLRTHDYSIIRECPSPVLSI